METLIGLIILHSLMSHSMSQFIPNNLKSQSITDKSKVDHSNLDQEHLLSQFPNNPNQHQPRQESPPKRPEDLLREVELLQHQEHQLHRTIMRQSRASNVDVMKPGVLATSITVQSITPVVGRSLGRSSSAAQVIDISLKKQRSSVIINPMNHPPHCIQRIHNTIITSTECTLPVGCGQTESLLYNTTWYGSEDRYCVGNFITGSPTSHNHDYVFLHSFDLVYPNGSNVLQPWSGISNSYYIGKTYNGYILLNRHLIQSYYHLHAIDGIPDFRQQLIRNDPCYHIPVGPPTISKEVKELRDLIPFLHIGINGTIYQNENNARVITGNTFRTIGQVHYSCDVEYDHRTGPEIHSIIIYKVFHSILSYLGKAFTYLLNLALSILKDIVSILQEHLYFLEYTFLLISMLIIGIPFTRAIAMLVPLLYFYGLFKPGNIPITES
jgi:hypothetical protein